MCESSSSRWRALWAVTALVVALTITTAPARASFFLGDLVYCDVDANGVFDGADFPLNGVSVRVVCEDRNGTVCLDVTEVTGGPIGEDIDPAVLAAFNSTCDLPGGATFDATDPTELDGRYLAAPWNPAETLCSRAERPWTCTVTVDPATAPADCNILQTPLKPAPPLDGNSDGDFCDCTRDANGFCTSPGGDVDGPFPEGQPLGNLPSQGTCDAFPCPAPGNGVYTDGFQNTFPADQERCGLHNDFAFTPEGGGGGGQGCTPGYWKQEHHFDSWQGFAPGDSFVTVFGVPYDKTLLGALKTGGGKEKALGRHAVAALLNSANGDVSYLFTTAEVIALVQNAWATGNFNAAKDTLEAENERGCPLN